MEALVELIDITAGYDDVPALIDANISIYKDDFIGIIGPNGGGKSTLIKVLLGLLKPMKGKVIIHKQNFGERKMFGYLPQMSTIDRRFPIRVIDVVLSGLMKDSRLINRYTKRDNEIVDECMNSNGIYEIRKKNIGELSGGQMQRVFLSRALVANPTILILDEPTTFIDGNFEFELFNTLNNLKNKLAILLVSHDIGTISSNVKTIACVNQSLHYHPSNVLTDELLKVYNCPVDLLAHGDLPHRVLHKHQH